MLRCWAHLSVSSGDPRPLHITWWGGALSFPMEMTNWAIAWKRKERTEWINATTGFFSSPPDTWRKYGVLTKSNRYKRLFLIVYYTFIQAQGHQIFELMKMCVLTETKTFVSVVFDSALGLPRAHPTVSLYICSSGTRQGWGPLKGTVISPQKALKGS